MRPKLRRAYIIGSCCMAIVLLAVILTLILIPRSSTKKYDEYLESAKLAYYTGDYDEALAHLDDALDIKETEECYLLLSEVHSAAGNPEKAIQILYLGYSRFGSEDISAALEKLKAQQNENDIAAQDEFVNIAGNSYSIDAASLVISGSPVGSGDINTIAGLTKLENLSINGAGVVDITPLGSLQQLTFLQLIGNNISDISALSSLKKLKTLYLDENPISDFSPLYGLTNLKSLSIKNIDITADQLEELQNALPNCNIYSDEVNQNIVEVTIGGKTFNSDVTELDLSGLNLKDISALSVCTSLKRLDLRNNSISDISPLVDLQELEWLCLWNNDISDLRPLMTLAKLKHLDLDSNEVTDITPVGYITSLTSLYLSYNLPDSLEPLIKLENLQKLGIKAADISDEDLEDLKGLKKLRELALEDNKKITANGVELLKLAIPDCAITHSELLYSVTFGDTQYTSDATEISAISSGVTNLNGLENFEDLQTLILTGNSVSDLSPLAELTKLSTLDLYGNRISDITPLAGLASLQSLSLINNSITDITALAGLINLHSLHLSFNSITDLSPLSGLAGLQDMDLDGNGINDISALSGLVSLTNLSLDDNNISDLSPLYSLANLQTLYIRGNSALTPADIVMLQDALPGCTIFSDYDISVDNDADSEKDTSSGNTDTPDEAPQVTQTPETEAGTETSPKPE